MSKDSSSSGKSGLLSKVVRFVSSPTTHWADLDRPETTPEANDSRLALKEMIERKRRNDFVRNREFDHLRKLRRRGAGYVPEPGENSSFSTSSQFANTGERAKTLKKIDEIEEEMSSAWLRRKQEPEVASSASDSLQTEVPSVGEFAEPAPAADFAAAVPTGSAATTIFQPTEIVETPVEPAETAPVQVLLDEERSGVEELAAPSAGGVVRSGIDVGADGLAGAKTEPELEEAAIRYANGDVAGAEAGLLKLLADPATRGRQDAWLTLFDLYRATGEQDKFDDVAIDFAGYFGRSAPQWTLDAVPSSVQAPLMSGMASVAPTGALAHWTAPSVLGVQSVATLNATLERHAPPWRVDWRYMKALEPAVAPMLAETLERWADMPVSLKFIGGEQLMELLAERAPTDDRSADPIWWAARLALLRLMGEMDEFELVALKYCVTYEVSPPAWQEPSNSYFAMTEEGDTVLPPDVAAEADDTSGVGFHDPHLHALGASSPDGQSILKGELVGELLGDAEAALAPLQIHDGVVSIELNCNQLERVDFGAAGSLLNWAAEQHAQGRQVVFKHVNRLVAAFFGVVGISEAARVRLRRD